MGRLRGSGPLEVGEGATDAGFTLKSYGELIREASSLENTEGLGENYQMNSSKTYEDIVTFKVSLFDCGVVYTFFFIFFKLS